MELVRAGHALFHRGSGAVKVTPLRRAVPVVPAIHQALRDHLPIRPE